MSDQASLLTQIKGANPILVEVTRGGIVESRHRGSVAVVDFDGGVRLGLGDIHTPIYPRSAIKALQAIPVIETGAADGLSMTAAELALCCASHGGERRHAETARGILERQGLSHTDLECGAHWPYFDAAAREMAAMGEEPTALHNNCSGKHSGMLSTAKALGVPTKDYIKLTHPVQQRIMGVMEAMTGYDLGGAAWDRDGCSVPTWAIPLENLAYAFARFGTGEGLSDRRAAACTKLRDAVLAEPFMVAGTKRYCTDVMLLLNKTVFLKTGAEGVFCATIPEMGLGIALKSDDGAKRGAEVMMTAVLDALGAIPDHARPAMQRFIAPDVINWNGYRTGGMQPRPGAISF